MSRAAAPNGWVTCPRCGERADPETMFCPSCGIALVHRASTRSVPDNDSPRPGSRSRPLLLAAGAIAGVLVVVAVILVASAVRSHASGLPRGTSLTAVDQDIESDLRGPKSKGDFDVRGVYSVSCVMPAIWAAGETFTCYAFNENGAQTGTVEATVLTPGARQAWRAHLAWEPNI